VKVTIEVTADDIANGKPGVCSLCPIALAILRALPGWGDATVTNWHVFPPDDGFAEIDLPSAACDFIESFDCLGQAAVEPFSFELDVPAELAPAGEIS